MTDPRRTWLVISFGCKPAGKLFFFRATLERVPRSRPLALGALVVLAAATAPLTQFAAIAAATAVLIAVAIADTARDDDRMASEPA